MFLRNLKNRSGSLSVQIIQKSRGKYKVVKTIGSGRTEQELSQLTLVGKQEIERLSKQTGLFVWENDLQIEQIFSNLSNASIRIVGPEIIFGSIYDKIGFGSIKEDLFRHLVIARIAYPLSKLKTVDYLYRYQGINLDIDALYRFLDKLNKELKDQVEQISYAHTLKVLNGKISVVFYDMTTLYFEAEDEDDLRKTGFSKDGKHSNPQIFLGLLVGNGGYAIGYDIYQGNIFEGHTLIPFLEKISAKFKLDKPIVVADAGLLISIQIDYEKFNTDAIWDGLKGYITNTKLTNDQVIDNYKSLWNIERAFRMSKTDLRIRPIYHRLKSRIEAHICISFTAYCIYKELERLLKQAKSNLSVKRSVELTHNMYQITYTLPESKHTKSNLLKMDDEQAELFQIISEIL